MSWADSVRWLWGASAGNRRRIVLRACMGILHVGVSLLFVWVSKQLVDCATGQTGGSLYLYIGMLAACILLQLLLSVGGTRMDVVADVDAGNRLRSNLFGHVMRSRWGGREALHTGDVMNRMERDVDVVTSLLSHTVPLVLSTSVQLVAAFCFLMRLDARLAVALGVVMPTALLLSKAYMKRMRRMTRDIRSLDSEVQAYMQEHLQHRTLVSTLEHTGRVSDTLTAFLHDMKRLVMERTRYSLFSRTLVQAGFAGGYAFAFLWGVFGLQDGTVTFGMMTAFLQLVAQIQRPVVELGRQVPAFIHATASAERLAALLRVPLEEQGSPVRLNGQVGIRMQHVCFAYTPDGREILSGFTHDFLPGSQTAIVGETGAGKSTLIRLILGLLLPCEGRISFYTRQEEAEVSPLTRCNVVYVPQGNTLMSGTIRDNLLLGNPAATDEDIRKVLHTAVAEFVYGLPEGLDTVCSEQGGGLSEGQAQRIAIARGLLRPGGILLLDEPTSSLDAETESLLMERLSSHVSDKTLILVTHREKMAELCTSTIHIGRLG